MSGLTNLSLQYNPLGNLTSLPGLGSLKELNLSGTVTNATFPPGLTNLTSLDLWNNGLTDLTLPADMSALAYLNVSCNQLTNLTVPAGLTNLTGVYLNKNHLNHLILPADVTHLTSLFLGENPFTDFFFLSNQSKLVTLEISSGSLTNVTLPVGLDKLAILILTGNPRLTQVAIPAGIRVVAPSIVELRNSGIQVTLFPVIKTPQRAANGDFSFELFADSGTFDIFRSTDLKSWTSVGSITVTTPNYPGNAFIDTTGHGLDNAFYEVRP